MQLKEIEWFISSIPLGSYKLLHGDLDTPFLIKRNYHTNLPSDLAEFIRPRRIVNSLRRILSAHPEQLDDYEDSETNIGHFIGMLRENYQNDEDVRRLLEIPVLQNYSLSENTSLIL